MTENDNKPPELYATDPDMTEREQILSTLYQANAYLKRKCLGGRLKKTENERTRMAWFKVWISYLNTISNQINQRDMDTMRKELDILLEESKRRKNR
jgi:hypothetical protein